MNMLSALLGTMMLTPQTISVSTSAELQLVVRRAKPGTTILIEAGSYAGGVSISNLHGTKENPIIITGAKPLQRPRFTGGNSGIQLSSVSHIELRDLIIEKANHNGLNIDDGGTITIPSHHITLKRIVVSDLPKGNYDGIKLSGLDDFRVEDCTVWRWGGSGIDMVGCHRGAIKGCTFREGGDSGIQAKGGSSDVSVEACRFLDGGQRGVNLGGSTGAAFFRPSLLAMGETKYEARNIVVEGCTFVGGGAPIAFVGVDGATVRFNTFQNPGRWVMRVLQETSEPGFVPARRGVFSDNIVVFTVTNWASGGVNIGSGTEPQSFKFARNFWFCSDQPARSKPALPTVETNGIYGVDPLLTISTDGIGKVARHSPAGEVGAHAWVPSSK